MQALLREHSGSNPIIYVIRDARAIREGEHLRLLDDSKLGRSPRCLRLRLPDVAHFEFFRVSEERLKGDSGRDKPV